MQPSVYESVFQKKNQVHWQNPLTGLFAAVTSYGFSAFVFPRKWVYVVSFQLLVSY